jgi:hypothetical protein
MPSKAIVSLPLDGLTGGGKHPFPSWRGKVGMGEKGLSSPPPEPSPLAG